jgi:hypothetical protein
MQKLRTLWQLMLIPLICGCAAAGRIPPEPPALAHSSRAQIGHLAVRGPGTPIVSLTGDVSGKGEAARNTAAAAGMSWLEGSLQAASEAGEGGLLVAAFGLITTPLVAAGGALYGAAAADAKEDIASGQQVLERALVAAPLQLRQALESRFATDVPVSYEFVAQTSSNAELRQRGFDSVLDISLKTLSSYPDRSNLEIVFESLQRATLVSLHSGQQLHSRIYVQNLPAAPVSAWASDDARALLSDLRGAYDSFAAELVQEFFLQPSIRVQGREPVSTSRYGVGSISGTVPMFVWSAFDGRSRSASDDVNYELAIKAEGDAEYSNHFSTKPRMFLPDPLQTCQVYQWKVRAHYLNFNIPSQSNWSSGYRFKTPCN